MMKKLSLLFLSIAISLIFNACEPQQEEGQTYDGMGMAAVPVVAAIPLVKDITIHIDSMGILKPSLLTEIRPQISGTLRKLFVSEGQWIQKETPIFEIDTQPFLLKVQEAEAQLAIDRVQLRAIQKKLNRLHYLNHKDLVARSDWEELESQAEIAQATITLDQTRLDIVRHDLEHCTQKAAINGRVGKIDVYPGLLISNAQIEPLFTISQMDPIIAEFKVTEKEMSQMHSQYYEIDVQPLFLDQKKKGSVTFLDNHFDSKTGQLLAFAKIQNEDFSLRPGQVVKVQIPISTSYHAILIPQKAVRYNQKGPYVYVILPDMTLEIRQIKLGNEYSNEQVVLEGLEPTEQIVLDGHLRLFPGLKVEIKSSHQGHL